MTKFTDLSHVLVEKYQLSQNDANTFIVSFVEVLTNGLKSDKQVKIKGLGTFKVVSVSPRESVDVNTGERILIEGREKISFTPENSLRDRVNSPFELFDTVEVDDHIDFSDIDEKYQNFDEALLAGDLENIDEYDTDTPATDIPSQDEHATEAQQALPVTAGPLEIKNSETHIASEQNTVKEDIYLAGNSIIEQHTEAKIIDQNDTSNLTEAIVSSDDTRGITPSSKQEEPSPEKESNADIHGIKPTIEPNDENKPTTLENNEISSDIDHLQNIEKSLSEENLHLRENLDHTRRNQRWLIATVCVLLLALFSSIIYVGQQFSLRDHRLEHLMAQFSLQNNSDKVQKGTDSMQLVRQNSQIKETKRHDSTTVSNKMTATIAEKKSSTEAVRQEKKVASNDKVKGEAGLKVVKTTSDINQEKYNSDPRVRTGAYFITGIAQTVKVRSGQTLSSISKAYLGPGMECYVEAVNDHKEMVKVGEELKIPSLVLKKKVK